MALFLTVIFSMILSIFGSGALNGYQVTDPQACRDSIFTFYYKPAAYLVFDNSYSNSAATGTYVTTTGTSLPMEIFELLIPVGVCVCVLYWAINLLKTINIKNPSLEMIYKSFMRLIVGCILISNIASLTLGFFNFSYALTDNLAVALNKDYNSFKSDSLTSIFGDDPEKNQDYLQDKLGEAEEEAEEGSDDDDTLNSNIGINYQNKSTLRIVTGYTAQIFYVILFQALKLALAFSGMTVTFDLARNLALSPLVCADVYGPMANNKALRFIRKLFAICMTQPVALLIIVGCQKAMELVTSSDTSNPVTTGMQSGMVIIIFTTMVGLVMGSKAVSQKLFG
jgi:hypothetical protein